MALESFYLICVQIVIIHVFVITAFLLYEILKLSYVMGYMCIEFK